MTTRNVQWMASVFAVGALCLVATPTAHANLEECGGVFVFEGEASCEFRPKEECMTECVTVAVETSCAAKIYTSCESNCTATASTECSSTCTETCMPDCEQKVAADQPPNCMGLCMSSCQQDAMGETGPRRACRAHNCGDKCEEQCKDAEPEVVECEPACTTACTGSCTAEANVQCQLDCQTEVYTQCETEMVERCETECETTGGAIFCNGQFLNATDINACADELASEINIEVSIELDVEASVDIGGGGDDEECDSDPCEEDDSVGDEVDKVCAVANVGSNASSSAVPVLFGLCALGGVLRARRKR